MKGNLSRHDLNRLSAEVAGEHSSILVDISEDSEVVSARCLKKEKEHNYVVVRAVKVLVTAAKTVND